MKELDNFNFDNNIVINGLTKELSAIYIYKCFIKHNENIILLTSNMYEANIFYKKLLNYTDHVLLFPMDDFLPIFVDAISPELKYKRIETLEKIELCKNIIVTNVMGYLKLLPNYHDKSSFKLEIKNKQTINRENLIKNLEKFGYKRENIVTSTGEYAVRGYIIDVFALDEDHPFRIELFGDDIESLRSFDEETQLSTINLDKIEIKSIDEIDTIEKSSLADYLNNPILINYNNEQIKSSYQKILEDLNNNNINDKILWNIEDIKVSKTIYLDDNSKIDSVKYVSNDIINYNGDIELLKQNVNSYIENNKTVVFAIEKKSQEEYICSFFNNVFITDSTNLHDNSINIIYEKFNHGFIFNNLVLITSRDIFEEKEDIKYKNNLHIGRKINNLNSLSVGDYVVHRAHGIGIYNGVTTLSIAGVLKDFLLISYLGSDKIYVPVEKIGTIFKYSDGDGVKPSINSLNSTSWIKKKLAVKKKIQDISKELIKLYAQRKNVEGDQYIDYPEEEVFANLFKYEETRDQRRAIKDVLSDLDSSVPMDRLLCGDVGFGKTEVAFRGIFKTVLNNHQVMYLCPTTILSKQQYESALQRFKDYPIEIALINRFTKIADQKKIIEDVKNGKIDILFGTHRLLSDDIKFKNLGLLVIDEEQRFGVKHKEKIKKYKNDVNVLTLSATPIPRTLKMSLSGLRDLSIIDTAPVNRYPVQTYVMQENEQIIKDAIYKELGRNGQIFILYNYVETIEEKMNQLKKLVPEARIRYAHGKLDKNSLDIIMDDFINHKFDILISTTIIETGIDIPNANTLLIFDADHFGLSQLYQLRGRVGRSNRIAYAYLMYRKNKMLNDIAVKRLQAIKDFTELGSGYKIAMRDLSIRGSGDILGSEQAGFVETVGINLYMKMIDEEIKRLKGEFVPNEEEENNTLINVDTHIDSSYVDDESIKILIHQKINEIDSLDKLKEVKKELEDRFGHIDLKMEKYMYEEWFEKLAEKLNITNVIQTKNIINVILPKDISSLIKGDKLFLEVYNINPNFKLKYSNQCIELSLNILNNNENYIYDFCRVLSLVIDDLNL